TSNSTNVLRTGFGDVALPPAAETDDETTGYEEMLWEVFLPGYFDNFSVEWTQQIHTGLERVRIDTFIGPETLTGGAILPVPEPSTIALLGMGALGVGLIVVRRRRTAKN